MINKIRVFLIFILLTILYACPVYAINMNLSPTSNITSNLTTSASTTSSSKTSRY